MKQFLKKIKKLLRVVCFLLPALLVFKSLFFGHPLFGGDAPYFYSDTLKNLFSEPLVWTQRGNAFGGINLSLWLAPIMLVYGSLGKFLHFGNDAIIRLLFLFPSLILSFVGPFLLAKYLKFSKEVGFFASLIYVFNTYYLLLVDGGQVGVALAYGVFPFALLFLKKFVDNPGRQNFFTALVASFIFCLVDPRIAAICLLTIFIWSILEKKFSFQLLLLAAALIPLNFYWLYPFLKLGGSANLSMSIGRLRLFSLINPLLLFSPNWPNNVFGKINYPPFYFVLIPLFVFAGLLFKDKDKKLSILALLFLIFAFLAKGATSPLGINMGVVFRDSSKFFAPVTLFAGILIGGTVSWLKSYGLRAGVYLFLLFLVWPAIFGRLNFLLSTHQANPDYQTIAQKLSQEDGKFRTVWLTRKDPLSYESETKPAIDGIELVNFQPFAQMNAGEDVFNFLNNPEFAEWFRILGIKYIFANGDARNINPNSTDLKNFGDIKELINQTPGLTKLDWGLNFPAYKVPNPYPKFYSVDKLVVVVGQSILPFTAHGSPLTLYAEDGKWDPRQLLDKDPNSLEIYFNQGADETDLIMSFLQKYFLSPLQNKRSEWAVYGPDQYLKYKYQLLMRGYKYTDFDYGKGLAFSSKKGEEISFSFKIPKDGSYIVAKRVSNEDTPILKWIIEERALKKGKFEYTLTNNSDLEIVNVVAVVPKKDYLNAQNLTQETLQHLKVLKYLGEGAKIKIGKVDATPEGTLKYKINSSQGYWIVFSDNYSPSWQLKKGINYYQSLPVYSMLNVFYVEPGWEKLRIEFRGQEIFRWGAWVSVLTILLLSIYYLYEKED